MRTTKEIKKEDKSFLKKWTPVFILSLALLIIIIDSTLLNVSLATLIKELNTDIQSLQWVITAYSLTLAALTITGGRLGDLFGRKRMFITGAIIFAIGSFIASISSNVGTMIIGESIVEGIGAALMMPATASLLISTYRGRDRAIAMGMWGGIAAAGSAIGPILGGYLTTNYSWRWGFRINIVVAAILVLGSYLVKEYRDTEEKPNLDYFGIILSSLGLLAVVFGIIESSRYGWWIAKETFTFFGYNISLFNLSIVPLSVALGTILLVAFVFWELKLTKSANTPLVSMTLFKNRQYTAGVLVTAMMAIGQTGMIFSLPVFFQAVRGLDAYHTGLAFLPMSITAFFIAPLSAVLSRKVPPRYLIQIGLFTGILGLFVIRRTLEVNSGVTDFIPGMILYGIGLGMTMSQLSNMTLSAVSVQESGEASGVNNTLRQVGSSLGSAIIGAALLTALSTNLNNGITQSNKIPEQIKPKIAAAVSAQSSSVEFGGGAQLGQNTSPLIQAEIKQISHQATADSNKQASLYAMLFTGLGFCLTFWLPKDKNIEKDQSLAGH